MDPIRISPDTPSEFAGLITASGAEALRGMVRQADENKRRADNRVSRQWDKFPAVITAVDTSYSPPRYSWYEQWYTATGNRETKPNGRTGTATYSPAFAYGDGTVLGSADLPFPTTLRKRLVAGTLGPVYEFPLYCACVEGGSGSGGSGGFVLVPCCPNPIPRTLHATINDPGGVCIGSRTVTLSYTTGVAGLTYEGTFTDANGDSCAIRLFCNLPGGWTIQLVVFGVPACSSNAPALSLTCRPVSGTATLSSGGGCVCGYTVTVTITE